MASHETPAVGAIKELGIKGDVPQVTTQARKEWGSPGHCWKQRADGCWYATDVPPTNCGDGPFEEATEDIMQSVAPTPSGQRYAGGPAREPQQTLMHGHKEE